MLFMRGVIGIELRICLKEGVNNGTSSGCENIAKVAGTRMELDTWLGNYIPRITTTYHSKDWAVIPDLDHVLLKWLVNVVENGLHPLEVFFVWHAKWHFIVAQHLEVCWGCTICSTRKIELVICRIKLCYA